MVSDWQIDNIDEQNIRIMDAFNKLMAEWENCYVPEIEEYEMKYKKFEIGELTEEEKKMIEYLKK